jgi:hypothetical protein
MREQDQLSEKESLALIAKMINKAKDAYHDTGIGAIMWGAVISFCSLVRLAEIQFDFQLPFDIYLLTIVAIVPQVFISIRQRKERKVKYYDEGFLDNLWMGFGISVALMIVILNVIGYNLSPLTDKYNVLKEIPRTFQLYEYVNSFMLLLYGMPTFVTGTAFRFKPMIWGGIFCWVCCVVTLFTEIRLDLILTALAAIFAWLIPGIILEREYRKHKKETVIADV